MLKPPLVFKEEGRLEGLSISQKPWKAWGGLPVVKPPGKGSQQALRSSDISHQLMPGHPLQAWLLLSAPLWPPSLGPRSHTSAFRSSGPPDVVSWFSERNVPFGRMVLQK